jgi:hypothetical protein
MFWTARNSMGCGGGKNSRGGQCVSLGHSHVQFSFFWMCVSEGAPGIEWGGAFRVWVWWVKGAGASEHLIWTRHPKTARQQPLESSPSRAAPREQPLESSPSSNDCLFRACGTMPLKHASWQTRGNISVKLNANKAAPNASDTFSVH